MDPVFNGGFGLNFHSSTTYSAAPAYAYFVSFFDGSVHHAPKPERGPVLPVRGGLECVPLLVTAHGEVIQDMNGDGVLDPIAEAVRLLSWAFLGARPPPVPCDPDGESVGLPDTGQTTCYDESGAKIPCDSATCPGQDGTYATGCPIDGRFVDNGDDTVTDNCAGLMWEKPRVIDASFLHWCNALQYCEDLFLAGHDDWRLPNVRELESLIDYGRLGPSIDPVFGEVSGGFWSSTSSVVEPRSARYVHLLKGEVLTLSKGDVAQALAVRTQP
jgi:hypothetical protein